MADSIRELRERVKLDYQLAEAAQDRGEANKKIEKILSRIEETESRILEIEEGIEDSLVGQEGLAKKANKLGKKKAKDAEKVLLLGKDNAKVLNKLYSQEEAHLGVVHNILKGNVNLEKDALRIVEDNVDFIENMGSGMVDIAQLEEKLKLLDKDRGDIAKAIGDEGEAYVQSLEDTVKGRLLEQRAMARNESMMGSMDDLSGGMLSKGKGMLKQFKGMGVAGGLVAAGLAAAVAILISFSGKLDKLGEEFGAIGVQSGQLQSNLLQGEVAATRLGKSLEDVISATTAMTDDFGVTLSEASALSGTIVDTSVAIGIGSAEAGKLMGTFKEIVGLSSQQSDNLIKQTYLLATASDVAPRAVMADIAGSTETVAKFTHAGGENIARAAIQARRLGTTFDSIASAAEGMLDFESSIAAEIEAQIFTGKQLNLQRARELSLAGDLEGLQKEITAQVGSEAEFNAMNVLQRQALAKAFGMSVADISKMVSKQEEAVTLAGQLAGQTGFDELVGEKGISTLTRLMGGLKSLGASLTNSLGPALNAVISILIPVAKVLEFLLQLINPIFRAISTVIETVMKPFGTAFGLASPTAPAAAPQFAGLGETQMATMTAGTAGEAAFQNQSMNNMIDSFNTGMDRLVAATDTANTQRSGYYADADTRARRTGGAVRRSFESGVI